MANFLLFKRKIKLYPGGAEALGDGEALGETLGLTEGLAEGLGDTLGETDSDIEGEVSAARAK